MALRKVPIDPIRDIERTVRAEGEQVVCCYGFGFAGALQHEELREDGDGFEPDGEGPEDLEFAVSVHLPPRCISDSSPSNMTPRYSGWQGEGMR